jgi:hypothetical protein
MTRPLLYVAGVALVGLAIGAAVRAPGPPDVPRLSAKDASSTFNVEGVRTTFYSDSQARFRVSARSVRLVPTRFVGPFRLGFMRSIIASDVQLELPESYAEHGSPNQLATDLVQSAAPLLHSAAAPLRASSRRPSIAGIEMSPLRVTIQRASGPDLLLRAQRCESSRAAPGALTCSDGALRDGDTLVRFAQATLGDRGWQVTKPAPR